MRMRENLIHNNPRALDCDGDTEREGLREFKSANWKTMNWLQSPGLNSIDDLLVKIVNLLRMRPIVHE